MWCVTVCSACTVSSLVCSFIHTPLPFHLESISQTASTATTAAAAGPGGRQRPDRGPRRRTLAPRVAPEHRSAPNVHRPRQRPPSGTPAHRDTAAHNRPSSVWAQQPHKAETHTPRPRAPWRAGPQLPALRPDPPMGVALRRPTRTSFDPETPCEPRSRPGQRDLGETAPPRP